MGCNIYLGSGVTVVGTAIYGETATDLVLNQYIYILHYRILYLSTGPTALIDKFYGKWKYR